MEDYSVYGHLTNGEILKGMLVFSSRNNFRRKVLNDLFKRLRPEEYGERDIDTQMNNMQIWGQQIYQKPDELHTDRYCFNLEFRHPEEYSPEEKSSLTELAKEFDEMHGKKAV